MLSKIQYIYCILLNIFIILHYIAHNQSFIYFYSILPYHRGMAINLNSNTIVITKKAKDGISVEKISPKYGLSNDLTVPTEWSDTPLTVDEDNKYLWYYEITSFSDGTEQSTEPIIIGTYGEQAKVCSISCDKNAIIRDDRLTINIVYSFSVSVQGYTYTSLRFTLTEGTGTETEKELTDNKYDYSLPAFYAQTVTAKVYLDDVEMDSLVLSVIDQTAHIEYIGVFDSHPIAEEGTQFLKGDCYFNSSDNLVYVYGTHDSETGWHLLSDFREGELSYEDRGSILAKTMSDALSVISDGSVISDFAYLNNLIASVVNANYISSKQIQLRDDGVIASSDISVDINEDIDVKTGLLTKDGFRLENDGSLRANKLFLGLSSGDNKIIIDNTSIRCIDSNNDILWELLPNGSIIAYNLKARGDIAASSLSCNALTTQEPSGNNFFKSSETPFTKTLYSSSEAINWIASKYIDNTIPISESAFLSSGWAYNDKSINHIALGTYAINETIKGEGSDGTAFVLGKQYSNSKTINAGDSKHIIRRMVNKYSFPIWVYAYVSLGGTMNEIHSAFFFENGSYVNNGEDKDAWCCLMPNQGIDIHAESWAWWGSQTGSGYFKVYPTYNNFCFVNHPVEATSLRSKTFTGSSSSYILKLFDIPIPTGHPNQLVVVLNGYTSGDTNLPSSVVSFNASDGTTITTCTSKLYTDDHFTWAWFVSGIPDNATMLQPYMQLKGTETDDDGDSYTVYFSLKVSHLAYAICYNYEAHSALIRYDDNSLQYLGTKRGYAQESFSEVEVASYSSSSVYNYIKTSLNIENGEYDITTEDTVVIEGEETKTLPATTITIDGVSYTNLSKMIVSDEGITLFGSTSEVTIYSEGYNIVGNGVANDGGWIGNSFESIDATISILTQQLGASTALLYPKADKQYDLGKQELCYRTLYVNKVEGNEVYGAVFN